MQSKRVSLLDHIHIEGVIQNGMHSIAIKLQPIQVPLCILASVSQSPLSTASGQYLSQQAIAVFSACSKSLFQPNSIISFELLHHSAVAAGKLHHNLSIFKIEEQHPLPYKVKEEKICITKNPNIQKPCSSLCTIPYSIGVSCLLKSSPWPENHALRHDLPALSMELEESGIIIYCQNYYWRTYYRTSRVNPATHHFLEGRFIK